MTKKYEEKIGNICTRMGKNRGKIQGTYLSKQENIWGKK